MLAASSEITREKLLLILHRAFVEARNLARNKNDDQLFDLADTFEVIPNLMADLDESALQEVERLLSHYQSKYPKTAFDYLTLLRLSSDEFDSIRSNGRE
jgi:hypothetical protein